jgi:flagellar capping protein FliD
LVTGNRENQSKYSVLPSGAAGEAVKKLTAMLDPTAALTTQSSNLTTKITDYKKQLADLDTRMTALLARYNKQFASMDSLVGQSKSLQTSLKSTFDGMMATYTNK